MKTNNSFSERLLEVMRVKQWTQKKLSKESGITERTISRWMTSNAPPNENTLRKLSKSCGVSISWLAEGKMQPGDALALSLKLGEAYATAPKPGNTIGKEPHGPPDQPAGHPFDHLGLADGMALLAKIYQSGDTTYIRAINANLAAFGEAIDNKTAAHDTAQIMEEMNQRMLNMENRLRAVETDKAELAKANEMKKAAANE